MNNQTPYPQHNPTVLDYDAPPPPYHLAVNNQNLQNQNQPVIVAQTQAGINPYHQNQYHQHPSEINNFTAQGNPNQNISANDAAQAEQNNVENNVCWLYAVGIYDLVAPLFFATSISLIISDQRLQPKDREKLIPAFFGVLIFLLIQFSMGVALILGLRNKREPTKIICLQGWLYGAYILLCKDFFVLFGGLFGFSAGFSGRKRISAIIVDIMNVMIRVLAILAIRKYVDFLKMKLAYGNAQIIGTSTGNEECESYLASGRVWHVPDLRGHNGVHHSPTRTSRAHQGLRHNLSAPQRSS